MCEERICVALAKLRRVGTTMYMVMSLTIDQLQFNNKPKNIPNVISTSST